MRCSPSIVPPELGPANAGPLCVLASPIGSIPEDTGSHSNQMVGRVGDYGGCSMKRREFITLLGGAAAACPFAARAQQALGLPTIGCSRPMTASVENQRVAAFVQRLRELGWVEGRTVAIKVRWGERRSERTAEIVAEFVGEKVDVIVAAGAATVLAAEQGTSVVPIVLAGAGDPLSTGFVVRLARPGGDVADLSFPQNDLAGKHLELLREVVPALRRLAILANAGNPVTLLDLRKVEAAAGPLGLTVVMVEIRRMEDVASGFEAL